MPLWLEEYYPLIGATLATGIYAATRFWGGVIIGSNLGQVMQVVVVFTGILIGFLSTSKSLLFAIPDRSFVRKVRQGRGFTQLLDYLLASIRTALALAGVSVVYIAVREEASTGWTDSIITVWVFLLVWAGLAFYRASGLLSDLLRRVLKKMPEG